MVTVHRLLWAAPLPGVTAWLGTAAPAAERTAAESKLPAPLQDLSTNLFPPPPNPPLLGGGRSEGGLLSLLEITMKN